MTESPTEAFSRQNVGERMFAGLGVPRPSVFTLPWPLSVNNLFLNVQGRGRVPTKRYEEWKREAALVLMAQRPRKHRGPVHVSIELCPPDRRKRDLDNALKCVLDALTTNQIIEADDSTILRSLEAKWVETGDPCRVEILPI